MLPNFRIEKIALDEHKMIAAGVTELAMDLAGKTAQALARRSSRRQFFRFIGGRVARHGPVSDEDRRLTGCDSGCVGCGGGPCNDCFSPVGACDDVTGGVYTCKTCVQGGGCPEGCSTGGEWFCCLTSGRGVPFPLLGVQLPRRMQQPVVPLLHEPPHPVHAERALR